VESLEIISSLYRHMEWADATVWRAVLEAPAACTDAAIRDRLHHVHLVQRAFLSVWRRVAFDRQAGSSLDLAGLARWGRAYHAEVAEYVAALSAMSLDDAIVLPWAARAVARFGQEPRVPTLGETLLQVAAHGTYHRGQVNARLREIAVEPPLTDFIPWVWFGKPLADWPAEAA
jgi:uncharacterized damage-inducible protein DinB